jgi:hypothetical protein
MQHTVNTHGEKSTAVDENTHGPYMKFSQLQLPTLISVNVKLQISVEHQCECESHKN